MGESRGLENRSLGLKSIFPEKDDENAHFGGFATFFA